MTTQYKSRITIACPIQHITICNSLSLILGESKADINTFSSSNYIDSSNNEYSICSTVAKDVFVSNAQSQLTTPSHLEGIDFEKEFGKSESQVLNEAQQAQQLLVIGSLEHPVKSSPDNIVAILGDRLESAMDHVEALEISVKEFDEAMEEGYE